MFNINEVKVIEIGDKIKSDEFKKLVYMWVRDYRASGDICCDAPLLYQYILQTDVSTLIATVNHQIIGFLSVASSNGVNTIKISYILPQFRNNGVATKLYENAITTLGAEEIEITFKRTKDRISYWKSLGFQSFKKRPGQGYSHKCICYLSLKDRRHSIMAMPLQIDVLNKFLKYQGKNLSGCEDFIQTSKSINAFTNLSLSQFGNINMRPKSKLRKLS